MSHRRTQQMMQRGGALSLDAYILSLGPKLWIAARKETAYADTDPVPSATDWSGNANHATQGTAANQPTFDIDGLGGRPAFAFDGNDYVSKTSTPSLDPASSVIIVVCKGGDTSLDYVFSAQSAISCAVFKQSNVYAGYSGPDDGVSSRPNTQIISVTDSHVIVIDHINILGYSDGVVGPAATGAYGSDTGTGVVIGNRSDLAWYYLGAIAEVIVLDRNLTQPERETLETLLGAEYGITITH